MPADAKPGDGCFQAMDQAAHWVRFADTKATILAAGFGAVLTMVMAKAEIVADAMKEGGSETCVVVLLAGLVAIAASYTLFWLVRAIRPHGTVNYVGINRFAWPTLVHATKDQLSMHASEVDVRADAWQQLIDLSAIANRKFTACGHAVHGFAALVMSALVCVGTAIGLTA